MSQLAQENLRRTAAYQIRIRKLEMLLGIMSFCAKGNVTVLCTISLLELVIGGM